MSNAKYSAVLFEADGDQRDIAADDLAFQDFGSSTASGDLGTAGGRISPKPSGGGGTSLYGPDEAIQRQVGKGGFFALEAYSAWFDIDTMTVLERCWKTMYPIEDYVEVVLNGQPDLYGPFWVPTTLIFTLFLSSSLSSSIAAYLAEQPYSYDFTRLSVAVSIVYGYALAFPVLLWAVMRYWAKIDARSCVEIVSVYGYATTVWIAGAILSIPPISLVRFVFTVLSFGVSLAFLLRNFYPIFKPMQQSSSFEDSPQAKAARGLLLIVVGVLHAAFGMAMWFGFLGVAGTTTVVGGGGGEGIGGGSPPESIRMFM